MTEVPPIGFVIFVFLGLKYQIRTIIISGYSSANIVSTPNDLHKIFLVKHSVDSGTILSQRRTEGPSTAVHINAPF